MTFSLQPSAPPFSFLSFLKISLYPYTPPSYNHYSALCYYKFSFFGVTNFISLSEIKFAVVVQSLSHVQLFCDPMVCSPPGYSMEFSRLPFPSPGDLPNTGIKPTSPALAGGFFTTEPPGKSKSYTHTHTHYNITSYITFSLPIHPLPFKLFPYLGYH